MSNTNDNRKDGSKSIIRSIRLNDELFVGGPMSENGCSCEGRLQEIK